MRNPLHFLSLFLYSQMSLPPTPLPLRRWSHLLIDLNIIYLDLHFVVVVYPAWCPLRYLLHGLVPIISLERVSAFLSSYMLSFSSQLHMLQLLKLSLVLRYFDFLVLFYLSISVWEVSIDISSSSLIVNLTLSDLIMMP